MNTIELTYLQHAQLRSMTGKLMNAGLDEDRIYQGLQAFIADALAVKCRELARNAILSRSCPFSLELLEQLFPAPEPPEDIDLDILRGKIELNVIQASKRHGRLTKTALKKFSCLHRYVGGMEVFDIVWAHLLRNEILVLLGKNATGKETFGLAELQEGDGQSDVVTARAA